MDITRSYGKHEIAPSDQIAYIVSKVSVGGTQIRLDYDNYRINEDSDRDIYPST